MRDQPVQDIKDYMGTGALQHGKYILLRTYVGANRSTVYEYYLPEPKVIVKTYQSLDNVRGTGAV
ncbi:MAG TPA: hypothetical protein VFC02_24075 [Anaerolineales bacterium]|nr:hypothetical protein [Anaerolineales bacterium]